MSNRYYEAMNKLTPEEHKILVGLINGLKIKHDDAWSDVFNAGVDACLKIIQDMSENDSIKAEPIRHGEWLHNDIMETDICSCCHTLLECDVRGFNYCPYCGAKMDGEGAEP